MGKRRDRKQRLQIRPCYRLMDADVYNGTMSEGPLTGIRRDKKSNKDLKSVHHTNTPENSQQHHVIKWAILGLVRIVNGSYNCERLWRKEDS